MMHNRTTLAAVVATLVLSSGCGGEQDKKKGVFLDGPVSGLSYETESLSGVTDSDGSFEYREGETIVFSLGDIAFHQVDAAETVTPMELAGTDDPFDSGVLNVVRLLQTLDSDSDPSNGIEIPEQVREKVRLPVFDLVADFSSIDGVLGSIVSRAYEVERPIVSAQAATDHFIDTLTKASGSESEVVTLDQTYYVREGDLEYQDHFISFSNDSYSTNLPRLAASGPVTLINGVYKLDSSGETLFLSKKDAGNHSRFCLARRPLDPDHCGTGSRLFRLFEAQSEAVAFNPVDANLQIGAAEQLIEKPEESNPPQPEPAVTMPEPELQPEAELRPEAELQPEAELRPEPELQPEAELQPEPELQPEEVQQPAPVVTENANGHVLTPEDLFEYCVGDVDDTDGDGYGWENQKTCLIVNAVSGEATKPETTETDGVLTPEDLFPVCTGYVPDDDGDGYGWQNNITCLIDPDATDSAAEESVVVAPDPDSELTPVPIGLDQVTDLIIVTGQSNAAGLLTTFDETLDAVDEKVFAFTDEGWQVADLHQFWDEGIPGNYSHQLIDRTPYNNVLFQIGKAVSAKSPRVIGLVLLTAPGEGISHWDYNSNFYNRMRDHALAALNALPNKSTFDAVIWLQGETDWLYEGTADSGATGFESFDSDFYRNYYPNKLNQLIGNLRSEGWYGPDGRFICAETKKAGLNPHLMALNNDADPKTGCAAAADLPSRDTDPYGNHFSAQSLRILGARIADIYLAMP
ncbi:hypothetical protein AB833_18725 [Chromatiales bacterium (ex Bugula neritina AB1)]|nr:hypothetical protein AB833_18725 [Chromatiales bacterium (ex Bugula neritina AB1)]